LIEKYETLSPRQLARSIVAFAAEEQLMLKLGSIVKGVIEENIDDALIYESKVAVADILEGASELITGKIGISKKATKRMILRIYALMSGLWQIVVMPDTVRNRLLENSIDIFEQEFKKSCIDAVETLIKGTIK
jgi:hypothetical protein